MIKTCHIEHNADIKMFKVGQGEQVRLTHLKFVDLQIGWRNHITLDID